MEAPQRPAAENKDDVIAVEEEEGPTYFTEEVRKHLEEHGWARLRGVLDKEATKKFKEGVATYYELWNEELTLDNPTAWSPSKLPAGTVHGINKIGGHAWFMWELRQRPEIVGMWAEYFNCPERDLRVSFDGFCVYLASTARRQNGNWGHFDHGMTPKPFKGLQSVVIMEDCMGDADGGLVVWDKSHRAHDGYFRLNGIECKGDWHLFPFAEREDGGKIRNERQPFIAEIEKDGRRYLADDDPEKGSTRPVPMKRKRVRAEEGDVVVWYSDTAHQNDPPKPEGRDRIVAYVSMAQVQHILKREFASRRRAFNDRATSSHWAARGFKRNGMPRTYSTAAAVEFKARYQRHMEQLPEPELTEVGKRLAGLFDEPHEPLVERGGGAKRVKEKDEEEEGEEEGEEEEEVEQPRKRTRSAAKTAKERLQKKMKSATPSNKKKRK